MNLLKYADGITGIQVNTGTYISLTTKDALEKFLSYVQAAEQRIKDERTKRREDLQQIATVLVLAEKITTDSAAAINKAFDKFNGVDTHNTLVNAEVSPYADSMSVKHIFGSTASYHKSYQRIHVKSGNTTEELGTFLIKHGAYSYSKKLKQLGSLMTSIKMATEYGSALNVDIATLTSVEFINSTAFERFNATYRELVDLAMESAMQTTVEEDADVAKSV